MPDEKALIFKARYLVQGLLTTRCAGSLFLRRVLIFKDAIAAYSGFLRGLAARLPT